MRVPFECVVDCIGLTGVENSPAAIEAWDKSIGLAPSADAHTSELCHPGPLKGVLKINGRPGIGVYPFGSTSASNSY